LLLHVMGFLVQKFIFTACIVGSRVSLWALNRNDEH
jgi:hypothetical protein